MSAKERERKVAFERIQAGEATLGEASERLGLSYRQCRRSYKRYRAQGDRGLVHRSRGRPSGRSKPASMKAAVLWRYEQRYQPVDMGPTLAAEKLQEEGYELCAETLRQWLLQAGLWRKRRKRAKHRQRRERKAHFGELVQLDGSHHAWFGPEKPRCCLMNMVDDATGRTLSLFAEEETTRAAMELLWKWIERYGSPRALYTDRKNVFVTDREPTLEEQLSGEEPKTAFGKACVKLGIEIITAHSPQAKGRVERNHGVYQDRLVKELALQRITRLKTANSLLDGGFVDQLNTKFAKPPVDNHDFHRPVPRGLDLADVFSFEASRVVQNDWTLRFENRYYQILSQNVPLPKPKERVTVRRRLDGTLLLVYRDRPLEYTLLPLEELQRRASQASAEREARIPAPRPRTRPRPAPDHPWRRLVLPLAADKDR